MPRVPESRKVTELGYAWEWRAWVAGLGSSKIKGKNQNRLLCVTQTHKTVGEKKETAARTLAFFGKNMIFLAVEVSVHL